MKAKITFDKGVRCQRNTVFVILVDVIFTLHKGLPTLDNGVTVIFIIDGSNLHALRRLQITPDKACPPSS